MLFHMSIAARAPRHVASVIAEFWGGEAMPFPPVSDDGWIAMAGDDRGTAIEVYPAGTTLRQAEGDADAYGEPGDPSGSFSASHCAIGVPMTQAQVMSIGARGLARQVSQARRHVRRDRALDRRDADDRTADARYAGRVPRLDVPGVVASPAGGSCADHLIAGVANAIQFTIVCPSHRSAFPSRSQRAAKSLRL